MRRARRRSTSARKPRRPRRGSAPVRAAGELSVLEQERITAFGGIPTHFVDLVNHPSVTQRDLSSVENAWIGGSPVMQATFEKFKTVLGLKQLMSTYGMTENTISTSFNRLSDPIEV